MNGHLKFDFDLEEFSVKNLSELKWCIFELAERVCLSSTCC